MSGAPAGLTKKAAAGFVQLVVAMGLLLFVPAWSARWTEGWVFLGVFAASALAITLYLAKKDPALLARRTQAGPAAEKEPRQKLIQGLASASFLSLLVVPALDHRFRWSSAPLALVAAGDALVALGFLVVFFVFRANTFTSAVIEVGEAQRVVDTGPYAVVRHPMYVGGLLLMLGAPLALGSLAGLAAYPPFAALIVWRLLDEERFLAKNLAGYAAYREKTRFRLIPRVW